MSSVSIHVRNLETGYKNFSIKNISFSLKPGDIMGVLGRSGCGKSTILNTLVGLKKAKAGKVQIKCKNTTRKEIIGYSPQQNSLYPFLTLKENLKLFAQLHGMRRQKFKSRMHYLLGRLYLTKSKKKRITELSGGMEKRADLAVTLIHDPSIIILDEPFTGLDISLTNFLWSLIKELASNGKIIIITSHVLTDLKKYCNKFGLIESGHFYGTKYILDKINKTEEKSLEMFLHRVFRMKN